jgi:selenocysteine-specific elongation factor
MSNALVIGTAGHIDHGKSALVQVLTGIDPDRLKEEKARGITIDLGFAHAEIDGINVAFVDVPGHERFVRNMLAGVGGIDAVLLVVAADESVMPQTREHFEICRLLRVRAGIIALTKSDLADAETLELARLEVRDLVANSFLADAPILPVSARTGAGLDGLRAALARLATRTDTGHAAGPVRLPIDRVFTMKGFGTVVTGTLVSGEMRVEDELVVAPAGRRVKVRGLQVHGWPQPAVASGHRLAVNLGGVDSEEISRGETLITPGTLEPTRRVDALIELLPGARPLRHGARVRFHHGTAEVLGRVSLAGVRRRAPDGMPVADAPPAELPPGAEAYVRLRLETPAVLTRGDRFILRAYSPPSTIAGGEIADPLPARGGARTEAGRRRLSAIDPGRPIDAVAAAMIVEAGPAGFPLAAFSARLGLETGARDALVARLGDMEGARLLGPVVVSPRLVEDLGRAVVADLEAHHRAQPLSEGLPREELRSRRFGRAHDAVFQAVLDRLVQEGRIGGRERLALATYRVALSPEETRAREAIEQAFREAALKPLTSAEIPGALGLAAPLAERMLKLLQRQRVLVKLGELWFHIDALAQLKRDVAALKAQGEPARVDVASFKEAYGLSRKFAIPLLEYLDRERVTRRVGDARVVL